jgi:hypothetical protein
MKLTNLLRGLLLPVLITACSGILPAPTLTPTAMPATATATTTILWFPPTETPTPFPTQAVTPTPDLRPGLGGLSFSDTFSQPDLWNTSSGATARATVDHNQLTLSLSGQGPVSITSLRSQPVLDDFYAEVTVMLSLCGPADQYGMLFRQSPGDNYYRLALRCDGMLRIERSLSGSRSPLFDWLPSGDAPIGSPAEARIGIWAAGREMRFFLNDNLQFVVNDPYLPGGTIGFYAFASGVTPITVSFSDLSVFAVSYTAPTPDLTQSSVQAPTPTP